MSIINSQLDRCAAEIARRSTTQQTLQAGTLSAVAGVGAAVMNGFTPLILLLVPIVCLTLGNQWLNHHETIHRIGRYSANELEPALARHMKPYACAPALWETYWAQKEPDRQGRYTWTVPVLSIFYGLAALALVIAIPSALVEPAAAAPLDMPLLSIEVWPRLLWVLDLGLLVYGFHAAWRVIFPASGD